MKKTVALILLLTAAAAFSRPGFFEQEESAQHLLRRKGDTFRFFQHNMICSNWKLASFDHQEKTGTEPGLHISDTESGSGVYFSSHNPIVCQPFTQYCLRFKLKVNSAGEGHPVELLINQWDFNRDYISGILHRFEDEMPGNEWTEHEWFFITPHDGHALMLQIITRPNTIADMVFDEVYLEQVSESGAFSPEARSVLSETRFSKGWKKELPLKDGEEACSVSLDFEWSGDPAGAGLVFEWFSGSKSIGSESCTFRAMSGVLPEWSGIQAEWRRLFNDPSDKASLRLDQFRGADTGAGTVERLLRKPDGADRLVVSVSSLPETLRLRHVGVEAKGLHISDTGTFLSEKR